jgi:class 3 adenylate cyclase
LFSNATDRIKKLTPFLLYPLSVFDESIDRYHVYKVETIGDSYMVVSGLPIPYEKHAAEMACLALELLESVKGHKITHLPGEQLQLRVGLHSGK